jgi:serine/threonine protein kinase
MPLSAGDKLGPYEILEPIGAGGMGEVYKARDSRLDPTVAIKISKQEFSERFEREARAVAPLNHPRICQLYDVGPNYLVFEFVAGERLKGPLPFDKALDYAAQICDALDAAHSKKITHRDLKPGNILVTKQGVKLLDFAWRKSTPRSKTLSRPSPWDLPEPARSWAHSSTCRPSSFRPRKPTRAATSSASAASCTRCSRASVRSKARVPPA